MGTEGSPESSMYVQCMLDVACVRSERLLNAFRYNGVTIRIAIQYRKVLQLPERMGDADGGGGSW